MILTITRVHETNGHVDGFYLTNGIRELPVELKEITDAMKSKQIEVPNFQEYYNKYFAKPAKPTQPAQPVTSNDMRSLVNKLNEARRVYEQGTGEIMSNREYDALYDKLKEMEAKTGVVYPDSPTVNVGYEVVSELPKEKHATPMLSLEKTKDPSVLKNWLGGNDGVLSWKMDGLTVVLHYNNGLLVKAVTRGNGEIGEIVTPNAKTFKNVPLRIPFKGELVLRGEAVIKYSDFNRINAMIPADSQYKNPRNLCSGSVRQLDSSITAKRNVYWFCFSLESCKGYGVSRYVDEQFEWLKTLGFSCVQYQRINAGTLLNVMQQFTNVAESGKLDIPVDGLVVALRDKVYGLSLGNTAKAPRHSMAFKWKDDLAETELITIDWSPSRNGLITPVAVFKPVDIEGSTVSRASLHNLSILTQVLGQPYVGQKIWVYKANMIIPQIDHAVKLRDK